MPNLVRITSMRERVEDTLTAHRNDIVSLLSRYVAQGKSILQPHQLIDEPNAAIAENDGRKQLVEGPFFDVIKSAQEAIVLPPLVIMVVRPRPGVWEYLRVNVRELTVDQLTVSEYLTFKEALVDGECKNEFMLELDFEPFYESIPRPSRSSFIGNGVQFLNRHLSSKMFHDGDCLEPLLDFLRAHRQKGHVLMVNDLIQRMSGLQSSLSKAEEYLTNIPPETPFSSFEQE